MITLRWSDEGIRGECADRILQLLNNWYKEEDDVKYVEEDMMMEIKTIAGLCDGKELLDFFDVLELRNISVAIDTDNVNDMVANLLASYLVIENKEEEKKEKEKYVVKVPVKVMRIQDMELEFEVDSEKEAKMLEYHIEENGLEGVDPTYEKVTGIDEEQVIEIKLCKMKTEKVKETK